MSHLFLALAIILQEQKYEYNLYIMSINIISIYITFALLLRQLNMMIVVTEK